MQELYRCDRTVRMLGLSLSLNGFSGSRQSQSGSNHVGTVHQTVHRVRSHVSSVAFRLAVHSSTKASYADRCPFVCGWISSR